MAEWNEETAKRLVDWIYWIERDGNEQGAVDIRAALEEIRRLREALNSVACLAGEGPDAYPLAGKTNLDALCDIAKIACTALAGEADRG